MVDIPGATGSTYTLVSADAGQNISVKVTATNVAGNANAVSANAGPVITSPPKSIDGTAGGQFSGGGPGTITLTTTQTNDVAVLLYYHESGVATISSVTSPHLTWTKRSTYSFAPNTIPMVLEIWWAPAAAILTAEVITITLTGAIDDAAYHAFGVNGCSNISAPWDTHASLATAHVNGGNALTVSGVSTVSSIPMLIGVTGTANSFSIVNPSGTTKIRADQQNGGGTLFAYLGSFYQNSFSALSSASYTTTGGPVWGMAVDALA